MNKATAVREILNTNGGRVVGKTRLQKTAYFLEALGVGYGFDFNYDYYGPHSDDLEAAAFDAKALGLIDIKQEKSKTGLDYSVFEAKASPEVVNGEIVPKRQEFFSTLGKYDTTALELAATADFLIRNGYPHDPWEETRRRKPIKASADRLSNAKRLLAELKER